MLTEQPALNYTYTSCISPATLLVLSMSLNILLDCTRIVLFDLNPNFICVSHFFFIIFFSILLEWNMRALEAWECREIRKRSPIARRASSSKTWIGAHSADTNSIAMCDGMQCGFFFWVAGSVMLFFLLSCSLDGNDDRLRAGELHPEYIQRLFQLPQHCILYSTLGRQPSRQRTTKTTFAKHRRHRLKCTLALERLHRRSPLGLT